jgi:hypothetical protein
MGGSADQRLLVAWAGCSEWLRLGEIFVRVTGQLGLAGGQVQR